LEVKICGITRQEDLRAAVEAGADSLGFVVGVPASARNLTLREARELMAKADAGVRRVAVTSFSTVGGLLRIYEALKPDYIQVHGIQNHGSMQEIVKSAAMLSDRVIAVVDGNSSETLEDALEAAKYFRYILLDSEDGRGLGGTGTAHDWAKSGRIRAAVAPIPIILAGGLTPENVCRAVEAAKPHGVDVSSGVEERLGIKDHEKIFEFVRRAKGAKL